VTVIGLPVPRPRHSVAGDQASGLIPSHERARKDMPVIGLALGLAALAALCNAVGDLLQRSATRNEKSDRAESLRLLGRMLRRPLWVLGLFASLLGLASHIGALSLGELATVQPILVAELPLAVFGSSCLFGRRLGSREWTAVTVLAGGLGMFVFFLAPSGGQRLAVPGATWATGSAAVLAAVLALGVWGWRAERDLRAALLSTASGIGYGLTGAFFATAGTTAATGGLPAAAWAWQTWAAVGTGALSFYLLQNALAAGKIVAVTPGLTLSNPLVAVAWGLIVFGESARSGPALIGTVVGAGLLVAGVVLLARSPVLEGRARPAGASSPGPGSYASSGASDH
jgi:drug/metabolite transporter (DMT)-like permease